jgi:NAD(P)-dependent dehydrogenase (short-subunit alcohol dehydrogenase family)
LLQRSGHSRGRLKLGDLDEVYARIAKEEGRLDILFANAGGGDMLPLGAITEEQFDRFSAPTSAGAVYGAEGAAAALRRIVDYSDRLDGVH